MNTDHNSRPLVIISQAPPDRDFCHKEWRPLNDTVTAVLTDGVLTFETKDGNLPVLDVEAQEKLFCFLLPEGAGETVVLALVDMFQKRKGSYETVP